MRKLNRRLLQSVASLAAVIGLGGFATYALFTTDPVTISSSTLSTGEATAKLCNASSDGSKTWKASISPALTLDSLLPGAPESELTGGKTLFFGNDGGTLPTSATNASACTAYEPTGSEGSSDINMKVIPTVANVVCPTGFETLSDDIDLKFTFDDGVNPATSSSTKSLTGTSSWSGNTSTTGPVLSPNQAYQVKIFAKLAASVTAQNKTCTFDINFVGKQQT